MRGLRVAADGQVQQRPSLPPQLSVFTSSEFFANGEEPHGGLSFAPWMVPALSVHLIARRECGFDSALVMLPMASYALGKYDWKACECFMAKLAHSAWALYQKTQRAEDLSKRGTLSQRVKHHKREEQEIAGYRVVVAQCRAHRPAFVVEFMDYAPGSSPVQLMHLYPAMGLS